MVRDEVEVALTPTQQRFADNARFDDVRDIVMGRCSMCHAAEPVWEGIARAPKNVKLETDGEIAAHAPCTVTVVRNRQRPQ